MEKSETNNPPFSLLWPFQAFQPERTEHTNHPADQLIHLESQAFKDLDLAHIVSSIALIPQHENGIEQIIKNLCLDARTIEYRLDILDDLMQNPVFVGGIKELLPVFEVFTVQGHTREKKKENAEIYNLTARLSELEAYIHCVKKLDDAFGSIRQELHSEGLKTLKKFIQDVTSDEAYKQLLKELPEILSSIRGIQGISIGVNLNKDLHPVEATLLSINKERYCGSKGVIKKLFGNKANEYEGIAQLHSVPKKEMWVNGTKVPLDPDHYGYYVNPILVPLFRDVSNVIKKVSAPIMKALRRFITIKVDQFAGLKSEFYFYLGALKMIQKIKEAGLPMCRPGFFPAADKKCFIKDNYNLSLAFRFLGNSSMTNVKDEIVKNDVALGPDGRIIILTGPNRGGKTTYTQGIGIAQVFAQAGLYVPGTKAEISPVDGIYTHFPIEEKVDRGTGRLGDEARRLYEILSRATGYSLILLNESFSSTSPGEGFYIARDIIRILRVLGACVVYATHLHELGYAVDDINTSIDGTSKVISMVALVHNHEKENKVIRTFKIKKGPPEGRSYALEIAAKYGISFYQLEKLFAERHLFER